MNDAESLWRRLRVYECEELRPVIVRAVSRMPEEVQEFAVERCAFLGLADGLHGTVWPGRIATDFHGSDEDTWIVLLDVPLPDEEGEAIVAHELAHAFLRHDKLAVDSGPEVEREAAELAGEWGFSGYPTDPDHCARLYEEEP